MPENLRLARSGPAFGLNISTDASRYRVGLAPENDGTRRFVESFFSIFTGIVILLGQYRARHAGNSTTDEQKPFWEDRAMKRQGSYRWRLALVVVGVALALGGGNARADFTFGEPMNLGPTVNSLAHEFTPRVSADGLELYFDSTTERPGGDGMDIWVATRPRPGDAWSTPVNLTPPVNRSSHDGGTSISTDGLELYFNSYNRAGGHGSWDIWMMRRDKTGTNWGEPVNLGTNVNTPGVEAAPTISANGLELYFSSRRTGGYGDQDIWVSRRVRRDDPWGAAENVGPVVNGPSVDVWSFVSGDGLALLLSADEPGPFRSGGLGHADIWLSKRTGLSHPWGAPVNLGPIVNSSCAEDAPCLSSDGKMLYFSSTRPGGHGGYDLWQAPIIPIVDFNGDGKVGGFEVYRMADRWGTDHSSCDIAPMPWGDGVVNVEDLKVLAGFVGKEIAEPGLIAHWMLDESEGSVAHDSAGDHDGTVTGAAAWRPDGGVVNGALELDGATLVAADCVLDPAGGPFSVLAWIKGTGPGQVIVSQEGGANWLMADPLDGSLTTELMGGRGKTRLTSSTVIADGTWHRVGMTWTGYKRSLYVDDVLVAEDTQTGLDPSPGGMLLGCDKDMTPGSFLTGLIDDVRIYNRPVKP